MTHPFPTPIEHEQDHIHSKEKLTMRHPIPRIITISLLTTLLAACAPQNSALDIQPIPANAGSSEVKRQADLAESLAPAQGFEEFGRSPGDRAFQPELEYFETVLSYGPSPDPRDIFLMVSLYLASNQQAVGIAFLEHLLARYENQMDDRMRAHHLAAYAILRATWADHVPIPGRIGWVNDTFLLLEEADQLSKGNDPMVHWASGLIYAQVPGFFGKRDAAYAHLQWVVAHPELEPTPGFNREAYRYLSELHANDGDAEQAAFYQDKSGYGDDKPAVPFMGWFTTTRDKGVTFSPTPSIEEIVPAEVFVVRGFGFSEIYFVISKNGEELIAVDAGTQPYSLAAAYALLTEERGELPPLTAALITHAHWDHIGGHSFLRRLAPDLQFYGRENYAGTLEHIVREPTYRQFRGAGFQNDWVSGYAPDVPVDEPTELTLGGTRFDLIPVSGGETEDAMLIHMPDVGVVFVGDVMMPYFGEPWMEEGDVDGALASMDTILSLEPRHVLHGHLGLTWMYGTKEIAVVREAFAWLIDAARLHISHGRSAKDIVRLNLVPPGLQNHPEAFIGYVTGRKHLIARIADQELGIWQENATGREPAGLDTLTSVEYGRLLELYLGLSQSEVEAALRKMLEAGDNELALQLAVAAVDRYDDAEDLRALEVEAADRLRARAQFIDPFAFVAYTELSGQEHAAIPDTTAPRRAIAVAATE